MTVETTFELGAESSKVLCTEDGRVVLKQDLPLQWNLEEVEDLFNRIAMVSQGRPMGHDALPTAPEFYAAMVILRECLHHLRFGGVVLQA